jgi:hypothetical protein
MRRLYAIIAAAGCQQSHAPEPDRGSAQIAIVRDARAAADASVTPAFDFTGAGIPTGFGGITLGDPLPAFTERWGTFAGADAALTVGSDDGVTVSQISIWIEGDIEPALAARFGPAAHHMRKGAASWLIDAPPPFDFSGVLATYLAIVPPDEHHVCGHDDGFAAFYAALQRDVRAGDWASVARAMKFPQRDWDDSEGDPQPVALSGPSDVVAQSASVFRMELRGGSVSCNLGAREYVIVYGTERRSPAIYAMRVAGAWRIIEVGYAPHELK